MRLWVHQTCTTSNQLEVRVMSCGLQYNYLNVALIAHGIARLIPSIWTLYRISEINAEVNPIASRQQALLTSWQACSRELINFSSRNMSHKR